MLSPKHLEYLEANGIDADVAREAGVRTKGNGIVFPWTGPDGRTVEQVRPDSPGDGPKYLWAKGEPLVLWVHPRMRAHIDAGNRVAVVEGTKQYLAAVSHAPPDTLIVGITGCQGWRQAGEIAIPDMKLIPWSGRDVVIVLDADRSTNRQVYDAGIGLAKDLAFRGAREVRYAELPGGGKHGLDDVIVEYGPGAFVKALDDATTKPGRPPKKKNDGDNPHAGEVDMEVLVDALMTKHHLAVDRSNRVLRWVDGAYLPDERTMTAAVGDELGPKYRDSHRNSAMSLTGARLAMSGRIIPDPDEVTSPLISVINGLLDPNTGELIEHSPDHLSTVLFPVTWDPDATCPTFDGWVDEVTDGRGRDLLESSSGVLDALYQRQWKSVFALGPTRSGKSTFGRLLERVVGKDNTAAKTLDQIGSDKFAAADLYGKVLNFASELSASHLTDVKSFMRLTGDDPFDGQRKFGHPFKFRNRALFFFASNSVPTVTELSGAYLARIRPFTFPISYEGRENPAIEIAMINEIPGILVRLVEAYQRINERGDYITDERSVTANGEFAQRSDSVMLFLGRCTNRDADATTERTDLWNAYKAWSDSEERKGHLGKHNFFERMRSIVTEKKSGVHIYEGLELLASRDWRDDGDPTPGQFGQFHLSSPRAHVRESDGGSGDSGHHSQSREGKWSETAQTAQDLNNTVEMVEVEGW